MNEGIGDFFTYRLSLISYRYSGTIFILQMLWYKEKASIITFIRMKKTSTITKGSYRHFKGKMYEVLGVVHHSETLEAMVLYKARYVSKEFGRNALWVRPFKMFLESVVHEGKKVKRFQYLGKR